MRDRRGFTMVEVLAASAIAAILLGAIGSLLFGSFRVAELLDARKDARLELSLLGLESLASELQRTPLGAAEGFDARDDRFSFSRLDAEAPPDPYAAAFKLGQVQRVTPGSPAAGTLRKVEYAFDESKKALVRRVDGGSERILARDLRSVEFGYALGEMSLQNEETWHWATTASADEAPRLKAVRVRLRFADSARGSTLRAVEKTFVVLHRIR